MVKHAKTNPVSEKLSKAETPRGNSTSERFDQAVIEQYKTEAPETVDHRREPNRLTR